MSSWVSSKVARGSRLFQCCVAARHVFYVDLSNAADEARKLARARGHHCRMALFSSGVRVNACAQYITANF